MLVEGRNARLVVCHAGLSSHSRIKFSAACQREGILYTPHRTKAGVLTTTLIRAVIKRARDLDHFKPELLPVRSLATARYLQDRYGGYLKMEIRNHVKCIAAPPAALLRDLAMMYAADCRRSFSLRMKWNMTPA
ncbi:hypothetical protein Deipe_3980 (plasmid) [Deinococcus peraridilitoris DSM 19664]|uniref:Uncharacterized protein n=1 Tax=Deinococcus peraridilitoris (strain DSM 19664 / LMG 22246 / CIP 109416 / KR-200) TaxID=937777 RepID=L0A870_DEIPD|nr:hypothetical protein Deipe_3980 [Deinococcus peraridilitoris DSM 19664]